MGGEGPLNLPCQPGERVDRKNERFFLRNGFKDRGRRRKSGPERARS